MSEHVQSNIEDRRRAGVASEIVDLLSFYQTGAGNPRDIVRKMRIVIETYCTATFPDFFDAHDTLLSIVEKIRKTGEQHPACALLDELDAIHAYSHEYQLAHDAGSDDPDPLDCAELTEFVQRTLKIVGAIPHLDN